MKIIHVCMTRRWGGLEMLACDVARRQKLLGCEVMAVTRADTPCSRRMTRLGVDGPRYRSGLDRLLFPFRFHALTNRLRPHVIHFHQLKALRRLALFVPGKWKHAMRRNGGGPGQSSGKSHGTLHRRGPALVFTEHACRVSDISSAYNSFVLSLLDAFIVPSEFQKSSIANCLDIDGNRLHVVYNGIDTQLFKPAFGDERTAARRALGIDTDCDYVVMAGRLVRDKGQDTLVEALAILAASRPKRAIVADILGDIDNPHNVERPFLDELKHLIQDRGLERRVRLRGLVEDVSPFFRAADAVVVPSRVESFGLVATEAMACGAPCVVSDAGALPEVTGSTAKVFQSGDANALAAALGKVLEDRDLANRMSRTGSRRVTELFSIEAHLRGIQAVYDRVSTSFTTNCTHILLQ